MTDHRTFKIDAPAMTGSDILFWQQNIKEEFARMGIICPIVADGVYGAATRSYTASLCHALGMQAGEVMGEGVTPELRIRIRNRKLSVEEQNRYENRQEYRRTLRTRYASAAKVGVHRPVTKIIEDSWGFHPGVHDGVDIITLPQAKTFAMVKCKVIDVRTKGWWGLGAKPSPGHPVSDGDGIVQMEILETVGPFIKGYHIGYGHNENPFVKVGDIVEAGDPIAHAGFANAWHIHLMYNNGSTIKGIGNVDPAKIIDYAVKHG